MAFKSLIIAALLSVFGQLSANAQNQDSVVYQVFDALTADAAPLPKNAEKLLEGHEWEALAYWDSQDEKVFENMHEAVGDIYQFIAPGFSIKPVNPQNSNEYLSAITGSFTRNNRTLILKAQSGNELALDITFIDEHYLILEIEGLRVFFTQVRSFNTH